MELLSEEAQKKLEIDDGIVNEGKKRPGIKKGHGKELGNLILYGNKLSKGWAIVGDVREMIEKTDGCYVTDWNPNSIARSIKNALKFTGKTHGREDIRSMDSETITDQIIEVYNTILRRDLR